ncbi:MAG: NADH-quinone oxidoreductase subunit N, partial [Leptospiraceae bacterium]|nr:NADH-quinone oxidoreductase subunit N [Leptospiraceae bacterium]
MNIIPAKADILSILPALILSGGGLILLVLQFFSKSEERRLPRYFTGLILTIALWKTLDSGFGYPGFGRYFRDQITFTTVSSWLNLLYVITALLTVIASPRILKQHNVNFPEFYPLLLFATTGMFFMTSASDLILMFVGLETLSIALYVMIGMARNEMSCLEASLKYFLLGAFTSGFMLMGIAFLYGGSGSTLMITAFQPIIDGTATTYSKIGLGLLLVGVAFKIALVPFHSWTPDVYEGALTTMTGFMASAPKAAAMGLMLIIFQYLFPVIQNTSWNILIGGLAFLSMTFGNILALKQDNLKRVLAYSSISHAGYVVAGIACGANLEVVYYLVIYAFTNIAAFSIIAYLENGKNIITYSSLRYLVKTKPWSAIGLVALFFSLGGIPPLGGFWTKLFLFQKIAESDSPLNRFLLITGVINSAIAIFYYLRLTVNAFMTEETGEVVEESIPASWGLSFTSILGILIVSLS